MKSAAFAWRYFLIKNAKDSIPESFQVRFVKILFCKIILKTIIVVIVVMLLVLFFIFEN